MARRIEIVTPENIPITLEPAGIGSRFGALLADLAIQIGVFITGLIIGGIVIAVFNVTGVSSVVQALMIIGGFLLLFGYFILFETIWNGQTPGKRMFGLRVVRDGGYPITFYAAATRNLVRIVDFLPASYAIGSLAVFFSPQYKRLGDMAAGTVVIKEKEARSLGAFFGAKKKGDDALGQARLPDGVNEPTTVLSTSEITLLRRFALRRWEMTPDDAERLAYRLIVPMVGRLNITFVAGVAPRYADLITVLVAHIDRTLEETEARAAF